MYRRFLLLYTKKPCFFILPAFVLSFLLSGCSGPVSVKSEVPASEDAVCRYREERSELEKEDTPFPEVSKEYGTLYDYCMVPDGDAFLLYYKEPSESVSLSDGSSRTMSVVHWQAESGALKTLPIEPEDNPAICVIRADQEGNILLFDTVKAYVYPKDAKKALLDFPAWPFGGVLLPGDGTVICQSGADASYEVFDLRTGQRLRTWLSRDFFIQKGKCSPFLDGPLGQELLVTGAGIYEHLEEKWVLQVPSDGTSLSKPDLSLKTVGKEDSGIYYVCDSNYRYRYLPMDGETDTESASQVTLKVSVLQDRYTLKNALTDYQILHPEITIDYHFQCVDLPESEQEMSTLLKTLNAEISSPQAADLYVLDRLPYESMAENGYLMELSECVSDFVADEDYFGNIMSAFRSEKGQYAVPWFFTADFIVCTEEMAPYVQDIFTFADYLKKHSEEPGLVPYYFRDRPDLFFALMYDFYGKDLIKDGQPDKERIHQYLEALFTIYDRQQKNPSATLAEFRIDYSRVTFSPSLEDAYLLLEKKEGSVSLLPFTPMGGTESLTQAFHHPGYTVISTGTVHGQFLFGIHQASENKEEAEKLLQYLFSYFKETGTKDRSLELFGFLPGIPVYKPLLSEQFSFSGNAEETYERPLFGGSCTVYVMSPEDGEQILTLLSGIYSPASRADAVGDPVYSIVEERSKGYLTGEKSLENAAEDIWQGLKLLYEEQGTDIQEQKGE